jgi:erythromycin esterase-like protein
MAFPSSRWKPTGPTPRASIVTSNPQPGHVKARDEAAAFARFPSWMWKNREVHDFVDWLRTHNEPLAPKDRAEFRGLDIYSLSASINAVLRYLDKVDPAQAAKARTRYACLAPWQDDPGRYAEATAFIGSDNCEADAVAQLQSLLEHRLEYLHDDGEHFFDAAQNARIVRAAEKYYRSMYKGARETWNQRDRHMFETLQSLLKHRQKQTGRPAKAVVWAHNSHIGNAAATSMGWQGEFNIGELARTAYGDAAALIGFGTDRGTVAAASNWDEPMQVKTVLPARKDSYEHLFRRSGRSRTLTSWRMADSAGGDLRAALSQPRRERAIGVVYRPETEFLSHYFTAVLPEQFDAYVWFEETKAVTPLEAARPAGVIETYPFGL